MPGSFGPISSHDQSGSSIFSPLASKAAVRSVAGLLVQDPTWVSGWTNSGTFAVDATRGAYVSFDRWPTIVLSPGGTTDAGGVREGNLFYIDWKTKYLFYGAGDGSGGAGGPWRPQAASKLNHGLTWTRLGSMGIDLRKTDDSGDGNWAARDSLFIEKRGATFYYHVMSASNVSSNVPNPTYESDLFVSTDPAGPWDWIRRTATSSGSGQDATGNYSGWQILVGSTYHLFTSVSDAGPANWRVGRRTATTPDGPWTQQSTAVLSEATRGQPENPKVWWSAGLNCYVMLVNQVNAGAGLTDRNGIFYSTSITDWSGARRTDIQRISTKDGATVIGLGSPFSMAEGVPYISPDGYVPFTYDTDPTDSNHVGRKIRGSTLELAAIALRYASPDVVTFSDSFTRANGAPGASWASFQTGDFTINSNQLDLNNTASDRSMTVAGVSLADAYTSMTTTCDSGCSVGIIFRAVDNSNYYLCDVLWNSTTIATFYKKVAGSFIQLDTYTGTLLAGGSSHQMAIHARGSEFGLYIDNVLVKTFTDTTYSAAGKIGLRNGGGAGGVRLVDDFSIITNSTTVNTYRKDLAHTDVWAEYSVEWLTLPIGGFAGCDFRVQANGDCYRCKFNSQGRLQLCKVVSGVTTNLGSQAGSLGAVTGFAHCIRIKAVGTELKAYLDGELQCSATDSTFSSGAKVGHSAQGADVAVRLLSVRTSDTVTITGDLNGKVVTIRAHGGEPLASATASGSSQTFTLAHYPADSFDVDGHLYTIPSGIWGGDTIAV